MKKLIVAAVLVTLAVQGLGVWYLYRHWRRASHSKVQLRAMMRDEDAPRAIAPSVGLQVNDGHSAEVPVGTPLWFTVGVDNAAASNELSAAEDLAARLAHIPAKAPNRARLQADYDRRSRPATITLGDAAHPWTEAVQLLVRDAQGGERALSIPAPRIGQPQAVVALDAYSSARANFGVPEVDAAPGAYSVVACLGRTGSWNGRACSDPVQLTVQERPARLARDRQTILDRQSGRFAMLAGDAPRLEQAGSRLIAADAADADGHIYVGEARYRQGRWEDALSEFTTARVCLHRSHPGAGEPPRFLDLRINQLLHRPADGK
jgi:hypothetical protein